MTKPEIKKRRYKRAHNMLQNNIPRDMKGLYSATRKYGLNRKNK